MAEGQDKKDKKETKVEDTLQNFPEEIYLGLKNYTKARPLHVKAKEVIVKKHMTDEEVKEKEGHYFDEDAVDKIYDEDIDV